MDHFHFFLLLLFYKMPFLMKKLKMVHPILPRSVQGIGEKQRRGYGKVPVHAPVNIEEKIVNFFHFCFAKSRLGTTTPKAKLKQSRFFLRKIVKNRNSWRLMLKELKKKFTWEIEQALEKFYKARYLRILG